MCRLFPFRPRCFLNGVSGDSNVNQELGATPGVGPWASTELVPGYSGMIVQTIGIAVLLLPQPEQAVHVAVMEEENRIESRRVVFTHVAVGPSIGEKSDPFGTSKPPTAR